MREDKEYGLKNLVTVVINQNGNVIGTGKKWEDKVAEVRAEMESDGADMLVLTSLDEVAWLLNLRGNDIPNNPGEDRAGTQTHIRAHPKTYTHRHTHTQTHIHTHTKKWIY